MSDDYKQLIEQYKSKMYEPNSGHGYLRTGDIVRLDSGDFSKFVRHKSILPLIKDFDSDRIVAFKKQVDKSLETSKRLDELEVEMMNVWILDVNETQNTTLEFPIVADDKLEQ